jgi:beta-galactosidase
MKKTILLLGILLPSIFTNTFSQRIDYTINSGWFFQKGEIIETHDFTHLENWERINLPHTWNNADAFDAISGYYRGPGWYAKKLNIPADWKNKEVFIHFEGANQETEVFINHQKAGSHIGGYTAFRFNITPYLEFGKSNLLSVRVTNIHNENIPPLRADFTFYGGVYRNVRLIAVEPVHFDLGNYASDGVFVQTNELSEAQAVISLSGQITNALNNNHKVVLETTLADHNQNILASKTKQISLFANENTAFQSDEIQVTNPKLWSPDDPYLYNMIIRIRDNGNEKNILDEMILPVGLRWFDFDDQNRFVLNGQPLKLIGTNRHQDLPGKGNALSDEDHRNDYKKIKELGFNFVRLAHYPQAPEVYRMCDRLGLLVWSEIPIVNRITQTEEFTDNCMNMQREHIRQTRNHPSMVFYGYMNEVLINMLGDDDLPEQEKARIAGATLELANKLESLSKEEAPEHYTVMAIHHNEGYNKYGVADVPDVLGWNLYFGWYYQQMEDLKPFLSAQHERYPDRPLIVSEYGPGTDIRNHTESPIPWDYSEDYQVIMHASYLDQMMRTPFLAGFAAWNFADFGSERRKDAIPHVNQKGLLNFDRTEKDVCNLYRAYFSEKNTLHIALRNYRHQGGLEDANQNGISTKPVRIFSSAEQVELKVNGESLGTKKVTTHTALFDVPFKDGINTLEAIDDNGMKDQVEIDYALYPRPLNAPERKELAVNVGSHFSFYDPEAGILWMADREYAPGLWGYSGGEPYIRTGGRQPKTGISDNILGTKNDPLFQTFVEGLDHYRFDVSEGFYEVTVCLVEPDKRIPDKELIYNFTLNTEQRKKEGHRVFDLKINGLTVLDDVNLASEFGPLQAAEYTFRVYAEKDDGIRVEFLPVEGKPVLSGIRIMPL